MKTKDFIAILQEADPTGEHHIRFCGSGVPIAAELVEGYFDGPHHSVDENDNYVLSIQDKKVDIHTMSLSEHVEYLVFREKTWEEIVKTIRFEFDGYNPDSIDERKFKYIEIARKTFDEMTALNEKFYQMDLERAIATAESGTQWFQDKRVDTCTIVPSLYKHANWKIFSAQGVLLTCNMCLTEPVLKSGKWEKVDNGVMEGYYQWIFKK